VSRDEWINQWPTHDYRPIWLAAAAVVIGYIAMLLANAQLPGVFNRWPYVLPPLLLLLFIVYGFRVGFQLEKRRGDFSALFPAAEQLKCHEKAPEGVRWLNSTKAVSHKKNPAPFEGALANFILIAAVTLGMFMNDNPFERPEEIAFGIFLLGYSVYLLASWWLIPRRLTKDPVNVRVQRSIIRTIGHADQQIFFELVSGEIISLPPQALTWHIQLNNDIFWLVSPGICEQFSTEKRLKEDPVGTEILELIEHEACRLPDESMVDTLCRVATRELRRAKAAKNKSTTYHPWGFGPQQLSLPLEYCFS